MCCDGGQRSSGGGGGGGRRKEEEGEGGGREGCPGWAEFRSWKVSFFYLIFLCRFITFRLLMEGHRDIYAFSKTPRGAFNL